MKKVLCVIMMTVIILSLSACNFIKDTPNNTTDSPFSSLKDSKASTKLSTGENEEKNKLLKYRTDEEGYIYNYLETVNVIREKKKNYEIISDEKGYTNRYKVYDDFGDTIDEGYNNWHDFKFKEIDGYLELFIIEGGPLWTCRYYDTERGLVSRYYGRPVLMSKGLILYWGYNKDDRVTLYIHDVFDRDKNYKELTRDFSPLCITGETPAELINGKKQLKISYYSEPNDEIVEKVFDLY